MAARLGARTLLGAPGKGATKVSWPYYLEQVGTLVKFSQFAPQLQFPICLYLLRQSNAIPMPVPINRPKQFSVRPMFFHPH